jgi:3-dehydrosphinganine reductase
MIFLLRVLANGVVPRFNSPLELVLLPLLVPIGAVFSVFADAVVWWSGTSRQREGHAE